MYESYLVLYQVAGTVSAKIRDGFTLYADAHDFAASNGGTEYAALYGVLFDRAQGGGKLRLIVEWVNGRRWAY